MAGVYVLSRDDPADKPADCMDKCVYEKDGDSSYYCFMKGGGMFSECGADDMEMTTASPPSGGNDGGDGGGGGEVVQPGGEVPSNKQFCDLSEDHTMCKYPGPSAECEVTGREVTAAGRKLILDKHNELRRKVARGEEKEQPKASNMREMVWNDELAAVAQRWADQCKFGHDKNRKKLDGTYVGQNVALTSSSKEITLEMDQAPISWYDEVVYPGFDPASINPFKPAAGAGHYTQVVWAESEELGCGRVMYMDDGWYNDIVVCNYAVGGNMKGVAMYKVGDPCSNCPPGYTCNDSLCAKNPFA